MKYIREKERNAGNGYGESSPYTFSDKKNSYKYIWYTKPEIEKYYLLYLNIIFYLVWQMRASIRNLKKKGEKRKEKKKTK